MHSILSGDVLHFSMHLERKKLNIAWIDLKSVKSRRRRTFATCAREIGEDGVSEPRGERVLMHPLGVSESAPATRV